MAYKIIPSECISCGSCQSVCPTDAISEGESSYVINEEVCISCGTCAAQCPVSAIKEG
ncbi:MAG TPA: 4Fe-4S binding protein [Eubacteriales bacterium]|nr:4Fe-4S binding protein [Eubacteriales bacterium]